MRISIRRWLIFRWRTDRVSTADRPQRRPTIRYPKSRVFPCRGTYIIYHFLVWSVSERKRLEREPITWHLAKYQTKFFSLDHHPFRKRKEKTKTLVSHGLCSSQYLFISSKVINNIKLISWIFIRVKSWTIFLQSKVWGIYGDFVRPFFSCSISKDLEILTSYAWNVFFFFF